MSEVYTIVYTPHLPQFIEFRRVVTVSISDPSHPTHPLLLHSFSWLLNWSPELFRRLPRGILEDLGRPAVPCSDPRFRPRKYYVLEISDLSPVGTPSPDTVFTHDPEQVEDDWMPLLRSHVPTLDHTPPSSPPMSATGSQAASSSPTKSSVSSPSVARVSHETEDGKTHSKQGQLTTREYRAFMQILSRMCSDELDKIERSHYAKPQYEEVLRAAVNKISAYQRQISELEAAALELTARRKRSL